MRHVSGGKRLIIQLKTQHREIGHVRFVLRNIALDRHAARVFILNVVQFT